MSNYVVREGDWSADVDDIVDEIRAALDDVSRTCLEAVERETKSIYETAHRLMPVKTGRSRDSLQWTVTFRGDTIEGRVSAGTWVRYVQSTQIAVNNPPPREQYARNLHKNASMADRDHPSEAEVQRLHREMLRRHLGARAHARRLGKASTRAARQGNAMWLLLRWPEKAAGDQLTEELGPMLEADMARHLED